MLNQRSLHSQLSCSNLKLTFNGRQLTKVTKSQSCKKLAPQVLLGSNRVTQVALEKARGIAAQLSPKMPHLSLSPSLWLSLAISFSLSSSLWLPLWLSLSGPLWLSVILSVSLCLSLALSLVPSHSFWLSFALSLALFLPLSLWSKIMIGSLKWCGLVGWFMLQIKLGVVTEG